MLNICLIAIIVTSFEMLSILWEAIEMLNKILAPIGKGIGKLQQILVPVTKKLQPFWDWVDDKWYRTNRKY